ncbi:hypothetical protein CZ674_13280 [Agrococcus casei LMG 22410]|uniref:Minor silk ampullate protein n=2 Tax=Agrococcus TaxID=46352 RepID=A0A1R4GMU9_9MICO|nr:hypothetical protein CZ674_13280 [Agrococcus casei LMG 22410]
MRASAALRTVIAASAAALVLAGITPATPAQAAAQVSVSPAPSSDSATEVTLTGSGFQYQPNAPGGVYVFFGAVTDPSGGSWKPSQGGKSGTTFAYAGTSGAQLLVAFEGGDSAEAANGMIRADGSWSATMRIPGSVFEASFGNPHDGQNQQGQQIDCKVVQCGIITIGAHGLWNANNESFTPITFDGTTPTQNFDDEATVLEVPGGDSEADEPEAPSPTETAEAADVEADAEGDGGGQGDADQQVATADESGASTWIFIVLGAAVALLLGAVVLLIVRSRKPAVAGASQETAEGTDQERGDGA